MLQSSSSANFSYECTLPTELSILSGFRHYSKDSYNAGKISRKPVSRSALRSSMSLDNSTLHHNHSSRQSSLKGTFSPEKSLTTIRESAVDALLDVDFTFPLNPAPLQPVKTAFLLADIFSVPFTTSKDTGMIAGSNTSALSLPEPPSAKPIIRGAVISIQVKENLFMAEKANTITSFEVKGSVFAKINSTDAVKQSELHLSMQHAQQVNQVNDTTKKHSLTITKDTDVANYAVELLMVMDDSADITSATGLQLIEYSTLPQFRPLPVRAKNKIIHIGHSSELQVVVQATLNPQFAGVFKSIKVQVSIAAIMNLISVKDARMDPMGSFDKNKKLISWLHEDVTVSATSSASKLTFTATIPITEADKVHLTAEFMQTVLPMIFKSQLTSTVTGVALTARFTDKDLVVSASTQIECRST